MKKYIYNPETLGYDESKTSAKELFLTISLSILPGIVIGGVLFFFIFQYFVFPDEAKLLSIQQQKIEKYKVLNNKIDFINKNIASFVDNDDDLYRPILGLSSVAEDIRMAGVGGVDKYKKLKGYDNSNLMIRTSLHLDFIASQLLIQSQSFNELTNFIKEQKKRQASTPSIRPVKLETITAIGTFGMRVQPMLKIYRMHKGIDFCSPKNTEIFASADGTVVANKFNKGLGSYIKIRHGYGYVTVYGHLEKSLVRVGQKVKKGEKIALMGTTGISEVDHLHYEVYKNGKEVNPFLYYYNELTDREYKSLISNNTESEAFFLK